MEDLRNKTQEITDYLRKEVGVPVIEMWECQWKATKKESPEIREFIKRKNFNLKSALIGMKNINKDLILDKVISGDLFGLIQCSIKVPDELKEYFADMPPIFKNVEITINDIGEHMNKYCEEYGLMKQPRRQLIGSYFGDEILLATPLLKWYLSHGLVVTDVQQVIEYRPQRCFKDFGDRVTAARRKGDLNKDSSILADSYKLLGNSGKYIFLRYLFFT